MLNLRIKKNALSLFLSNSSELLRINNLNFNSGSAVLPPNNPKNPQNIPK
jgi:hypothetical protein